MNPDDFPAPREGFVITHFLVVSDQVRSREYYRSLFDEYPSETFGKSHPHWRRSQDRLRDFATPASTP